MLNKLLQQSFSRLKLNYCIFFLAFAGFTNVGQSQCTYTLELFDSFGDGWNGSFLTVEANGTSTDYTIPDNFDATYTIDFPINSLVVISYTAGNFQNEVTYNILDPSGEIVFNDGPFPQTGVIYSFFACPTCPGPFALFVDDIGGVDAEVSWSPIDSSGVFMVEYGLAGFTPNTGAGTSFTTTDLSSTLTGLTEDTAYDFYVSVACDNGDTSAIIGPGSFQTIWLIDVGIVEIHTPETQCGLGNETIEVTLKNFGDNPQSLIPFKYAVNDISAGVTQPLDGFYTGVLSTDSTTVLSFETTFDFSSEGQYEIVAWTSLEGDNNVTNDSSSYMVTNIPIVSDFPYFMNFETWNGGWTLDEDNSISSTWDFGMPEGNAIADAASGVNAFVTNLSGNYNNGELSYILSPCLDFSGLAEDPIINLAVNFNTETNYDGGWLEVSIDDGLTWSKVGAMGTGTNWYSFNNTTQGLGDVWAGDSNGWINAENTLTGVAGQSTVKLRFAFDSDGSVNGFDGIGIDDVLISPILADDLSALSAVNAFNQGCGDEMDEVTIEIRNAGTNNQTGFDVSYQINGGTIVTENVGGLIVASGGIETYTFTTTFDSKMFGTDFEIVAWTNLVGELNVLNDTTSFAFTTIIPDVFPIMVDFEDGVIPNGWTTTDFGIGNGHNNASVAIYDNIYSGDPNYEMMTTNYGPVNPGDSMTYDYRYTIWSAGTDPFTLGVGDMLEVQISTDCGSTFTTVQTVDMNNHIPSAVMTNRLVDLDPFAGEIIIIKFVATWGTGDYWFDLDNINVIACPPDFGLDVMTNYVSEVGAADGSISLNPTQGTAPFNIVWDDPNAPNDIMEGTYTVTITDGIGCEQVESIELGVCSGNLELAADIMGVSLSGETDGTATINSGTGNGPYTFEWSTGDSTATATNLAEGDYSVTVTDNNGCPDEIMISVGIFVGLDDLEGRFSSINLAPNPTIGYTELSVELSQSSDVMVQVFNMVGQVVFESPKERLMSKKFQLDLSEYPGGMYFVRVFADEQSQIVKLIKN